ncbi:MAG: glycosyltransferase, partial [Armatimonadetes bacterium]|nr:glycosyltransferase [Armatimonadota bacterium]
MADNAGILQLVPRGDADAAEQVRILVEGLDRHRYQPLVAGELTPQMRERLSRQDIPWVYLEIPQGFSLGAYLAAAGQLRRLSQARDIALVHCHNMEATAVAVLASRGWGVDSAVPLVSSLHAPREGLAPAYHGWARRVGMRWLLERCDTVIVSSQYDRQQLAQLAPPIKSRMHVIYPSLERSPSRPLEAGVKRHQVGLHR